jgi:hypothetical protein
MPLAHCECNNVRVSYKHTQYLKERRQMMLDWANYLDSLKQKEG